MFSMEKRYRNKTINVTCGHGLVSRVRRPQDEHGLSKLVEMLQCYTENVTAQREEKKIIVV